jgi:hypothetical protein
MIDTNALPSAQATMALATGGIASTFNAWHVVALGVGGVVVHVYHTVVNAGGVKKLWSAFWDGPADRLAIPQPQESIKTQGDGGHATGAPAEPTAVPALSPDGPGHTTIVPPPRGLPDPRTYQP